MTQSTLKKSAYVAVGVPVHLMSLLRDRVASTRDAVEDLRDRLSEDAQAAFDEWVTEGERLVASLRGQVRDRQESITGTVRSSAGKAKDVGRGLTATLTEPVVSIDEIDGVGPAYAEKLATAGVISTRALVERCDSAEAIARLSDQTGIATALIERWVASADLSRVKGVGDEHMSLLNRIGVGSIAALAAANAADLHRRTVALEEDVPARVSAIPSEATLGDWIRQAKALAKQS